MDSTPLSLLMNAYYQAMTFGYGRTVTEALALLNYLVTIELIFMGLWWTISEENYTAVALSKVFTVSVVVWLLTGWPDLMDVLQRTFIEGGLRAAGSVLTVSDFRNPSNIFSFGAQVHAVLMGQLAQRSAWNALRHLPQILMSTTTALFILLAYAIMAIQIAVAMLEFYLIATVTVFLLPFSVFKPLAFLAEKAIGARHCERCATVYPELYHGGGTTRLYQADHARRSDDGPGDSLCPGRRVSTHSRVERTILGECAPDGRGQPDWARCAPHGDCHRRPGRRDGDRRGACRGSSHTRRTRRGRRGPGRPGGRCELWCDAYDAQSLSGRDGRRSHGASDSTPPHRPGQWRRIPCGILRILAPSRGLARAGHMIP